MGKEGRRDNTKAKEMCAGLPTDVLKACLRGYLCVLAFFLQYHLPGLEPPALPPRAPLLSYSSSLLLLSPLSQLSHTQVFNLSVYVYDQTFP